MGENVGCATAIAYQTTKISTRSVLPRTTEFLLTLLTKCCVRLAFYLLCKLILKTIKLHDEVSMPKRCNHDSPTREKKKKTNSTREQHCVPKSHVVHIVHANKWLWHKCICAHRLSICLSTIIFSSPRFSLFLVSVLQTTDQFQSRVAKR